jgi:hypothetical protein
MFEMKSHRTNPGYGSNRTARGARMFHDSHDTVQTKMMTKKPMEPTRRVIQRARRSRGEAGIVFMPSSFGFAAAGFALIR